MDLDLNRLRFLSFFAISKESLRIVFSWRKYGVGRTSLLYVSCLSLGIFSFSTLIVSFRFTYEYQKNSMDISAIILSHLKSRWFSYLQLIVLLPYIYLNSISLAVYSVACIFSGNEEILSPTDIKKIIQSVSKRALTTFLWSVAITGSYTILDGFLAFFCVFFDCFRLVGAVILAFYVMGFVYICSVAYLAQVVSILEDFHGFEAFVRSNSLIRGKLGLASAIFLVGFSSAAIIIFLPPFLFYLVPVESVLSAVAPFVVVVALGSMVSATTILFHLVAETIVYFVCRSHHDDDIEKSVLAGLLTNFFNEVYAAIPSTADEGQAEIAEKPSIYSLKNPWIAFLFAAVCVSLPILVIYFANMVE